MKDGKIYARGATDDKGQLFIHVKALESYLKTSGAAPVNVKFLIEGEEEVSSPNLTPFIEEHLDLLKADVCVISDTSMGSIDAPSITHSLRGMTYIEVEVEGPKEDLHSGLWGGAAHNPALALVEMLGKLYNPDNTIAVPGFYDDVVALTEAERAMIAKTDLSEAQYQAVTGVPAVWGDASASPSASASPRARRWTSTACGAAGPAPAPRRSFRRRRAQNSARGWWRNQDPHKIFALLKNYLESIAPPTVKLKVSLLTTGKAALDSLRHSRNAGGGTRLRAGLGTYAASSPRRRQHPGRRRHRQFAAYPGGDDGLRAG